MPHKPSSFRGIMRRRRRPTTTLISIPHDNEGKPHKNVMSGSKPVLTSMLEDYVVCQNRTLRDRKYEEPKKSAQQQSATARDSWRRIYSTPEQPYFAAQISWVSSFCTIDADIPTEPSWPMNRSPGNVVGFLQSAWKRLVEYRRVTEQEDEDDWDDADVPIPIRADTEFESDFDMFDDVIEEEFPRLRKAMLERGQF